MQWKSVGGLCPSIHTASGAFRGTRNAQAKKKKGKVRNSVCLRHEERSAQPNIRCNWPIAGICFGMGLTFPEFPQGMRAQHVAVREAPPMRETDVISHIRALP